MSNVIERRFLEKIIIWTFFLGHKKILLLYTDLKV